MKKFSFFVLLALLGTTVINAQKLSSKKLDWGIKTGINFSNLRMSNGNNADWKTGLAAGAFFRIKGGNKFSIQPEFLYSSMGGKDLVANSGSSLRLNYFSIPVLAKYRVGKNFSIVAGPQIDVLIQAKTKSSTNQFSKVTDNYKEDSFNGTAGFEFWPIRSFGLSARYIYGFNNINNTAGTAGMDLKNQGIQIMAALKL